jgi:lipopolysaccharide/colanic/teichoic acid biosynthesis glycosyltransferase
MRSRKLFIARRITKPRKSLLPQYLNRYNENQIKRQNVKPGITGLAQVMGRNNLSWESKFNYDLKYVETISFLLDLKILFQTFINVIKRDGINTVNNEIMHEFLGNNID